MNTCILFRSSNFFNNSKTFLKISPYNISESLNFCRSTILKSNTHEDNADTFGNSNVSNEINNNSTIKKELLKHVRLNSRESDDINENKYSNNHYQKRSFKNHEKRLSRERLPDQFGTLDKNFAKRFEIDLLPQDDELVSKKMDALEHDPETHYEYFLRMLDSVKQNKLKEALSIFQEMKSEQIRPQIYVFTLLIGACGRAGYTKMAFKLFKQMREYGYTPYPTTLTGLFNSCAECPFPEYGLKQARFLREKIILNNFETNEILYNAMIKAFGRCGDLKTAFELVDEMAGKKLHISRSALNHLLIACASDKESGFTHAIMVIRKLNHWKLGFDENTYNLLLRCTRDCGIGSEEIRSQLLISIGPPSPSLSSSKKLSDGGIPPISNPTPINFLKKSHLSKESASLIVGLNEASSPENRLALLGGTVGFLQHMAENKVQPSPRTLTLLLDCIPSTFEAEKQLLTAIKCGALHPDVDFFNMLMKRRCFRHHYKEAKDVLELISSQGLSPNLLTFGVLALACRSRNDFATFIKDLEDLNVHPNIEMLGAVLGTAVRKQNFFLILDVMNAMRKFEVKPDHLVLKLLEKALKEGERQLWILENQSNEAHRFTKSPSFKSGYTFFRMNYKNWLQSVKMDLPAHPWDQYIPDKLEETVKTT